MAIDPILSTKAYDPKRVYQSLINNCPNFRIRKELQKAKKKLPNAQIYYLKLMMWL